MLTNPEARRALRTVALILFVAVTVGFIGWAIHLLRTEAEPVSRIAMGLVGVLLAFVVLTGAENFRRAKFEATLPGGSKLGGELDGDPITDGDTVKVVKEGK